MNKPSTSIDLQDLDPDPIKQFRAWFEKAIEMKLPEPNAMTLATVSPEGKPSARIVLLKGFDERGFTFFTNYESQKAKELLANPWAALVLHWTVLERQVRICGKATKTTRTESEAYFKTRPRGSQIGAWASPQSEVIPNRSFLEDKAAVVARRYEGQEVPCPPGWGGFVLLPETIEFWQGRADRLHDRFRYTRLAEDRWKLERISP